MGITTESCDPRRTMRSDARRNYERLVAMAREVFTEQGPDAPLDEIARRAEVGPGTLYRHFPNRVALLEAVFRDEIGRHADRAYTLLKERGPADALAGWIREQVGHASSIRGLASALQAAMDEGSGCFAPCTTRLCCAAETLLTAAREVGAVRADIDADDLLRLGHAIAAVADAAPEKAERLVSVLISGLRPECPSGLLPQPRR